MNRAVFISGYGIGMANANNVADVLRERYDEVEPFTFAYAMKNPEVINDITEGVDLFTHSAAMMAVLGASPNNLHAFDAPLPTGRGMLAGHVLAELFTEHMPIKGGLNLKSAPNILLSDWNSAKEIIGHPFTHLKPYANESISQFNAIDEAIIMQKNDINVILPYTGGDKLFIPTPEQEHTAKMNKVRILHLAGRHNEIILRPQQCLEEYFEKIAA